MTSEQIEPQPSQAIDGKYLVLVGVLMAAIMISLAWLWLTERNRRVAAELQVTQQQKQVPVGLALQTMLEQRKAQAIHRIDRDRLVTEDIILDGKPLRALRLDALTASELGFVSGDVILVDTPATAPSESP